MFSLDSSSEIIWGEITGDEFSRRETTGAKLLESNSPVAKLPEAKLLMSNFPPHITLWPATHPTRQLYKNEGIENPLNLVVQPNGIKKFIYLTHSRRLLFMYLQLTRSISWSQNKIEFFLRPLYTTKYIKELQFYINRNVTECYNFGARA